MQNTGTLVTAAIRPNDSADKIATFLANEGKGGHHSYQTLAERDAIIVERREWGMTCDITDTKITYKLVKGFKNTTITDNGNWIVYKDENAPLPSGGLAIWELSKAPYPIDEHVSHSDKIWQSTIANNSLVPGAIDGGTGLPNTAWKEVTKDSLSHARNQDTQLKRSNGTTILADNIATILSMQFTAFVSKGGNNTTAAIGRMDLTYLTVQAAVNSNAINVVVLGGTYNEQVQILNSSPLQRILLWFGACITSAAAYTIENGRNALTIEGQGLFNHIFGAIQESAIVNTNATGITMKLGGNPGAVYLNLSNLYLRSEGTGEGAAIFNNWNWPINATNCKFYAARTITKFTVQVRFKDCILDSGNYIHESDAYSGLTGYLENCQINSVNGFYGSAKGVIYRGGTYKTTTGPGFNLINGSTGFALKHLTLVSQSHCIAGDSGTMEIDGCELQSIAGMVYNANLYNYINPSITKAEIRNSKLMAEASQTNAIQNNHAPIKNFNLINVIMNKGYNANVDGIIHNVLIEDTLTAF